MALLRTAAADAGGGPRTAARVALDLRQRRIEGMAAELAGALRPGPVPGLRWWSTPLPRPLPTP